jgi:hypothetical protein
MAEAINITIDEYGYLWRDPMPGWEVQGDRHFSSSEAADAAHEAGECTGWTADGEIIGGRIRLGHFTGARWNDGPNTSNPVFLPYRLGTGWEVDAGESDMMASALLASKFRFAGGDVHSGRLTPEGDWVETHCRLAPAAEDGERPARMTPLERAARAAAQVWWRNDVDGDWPHPDELTEPDLHLWKCTVEAVLSAIREPSEGMLYAAACADNSAGYCGDEALAAFYTAMIDAMLAEGE